MPLKVASIKYLPEERTDLNPFRLDLFQLGCTIANCILHEKNWIHKRMKVGEWKESLSLIAQKDLRKLVTKLLAVEEELTVKDVMIDDWMTQKGLYPFPNPASEVFKVRNVLSKLL